MVKNLPDNAGDKEMQAWSLTPDPLKKEMATHSSILAWKIPSTEEPGGLQSMGSQKESDTERLNNSNNKVPFNCKDFSYPVLFFFRELSKQSNVWLLFSKHIALCQALSNINHQKSRCHSTGPKSHSLYLAEPEFKPWKSNGSLILATIPA